MTSIEQGEVDRFVEFLRRADEKIEKQRWSESFSGRKRKESEFHNWARTPARQTADKVDHWEKEHANKMFYDTARESFEYSRRWMLENAPGMIFLDYACGDGGNAMLAAESGAALAIGIDISPVSIENCRRIAAKKGLARNTYFLIGDCESTGFPDNSVDRIICMGCLHHLDLSYAFPELRRILKPGGRIHALESLAYNPIIRLYRMWTPGLRTEWEKHHILSLRELRFARHFFQVQNVRYFHLLSILTTPLRNTQLFQPLLEVANAIDRALLKVPPISLMAWMFSFELVKRADS